MPKNLRDSQSPGDEMERPKKRLRKDVAKKSKTAPKQIRGWRGALKVLLDMPLDILFETFGHLEPLDLLRLARTSKALREILMNRSSITIWRKSLSQMEGLPACFVGMNEPQYTHLMFDETCHFCAAENAHEVIMLARLRCCRICGLAKFEQMCGIPVDMGFEIYDITPYTLDLANAWYEQDEPKHYVDEMNKLHTDYKSLRSSTQRKLWLSKKELDFKAMVKAAPAYSEYLDKRVPEGLKLKRKKRAAVLKSKASRGEYELNKWIMNGCTSQSTPKFLRSPENVRPA